MPGIFRLLDVSASALDAERTRLEVHLTNLANANTTRTEQGGPYKRRAVVFEAQPLSFEETLQGVRARLTIPEQQPQKVFDPGHPDADEYGYLALPDIDPVLEQADIVSAARSYEANLAVVKITKDMLARALEIGN